MECSFPFSRRAHGCGGGAGSFDGGGDENGRWAIFSGGCRRRRPTSAESLDGRMGSSLPLARRAHGCGGACSFGRCGGEYEERCAIFSADPGCCSTSVDSPDRCMDFSPAFIRPAPRAGPAGGGGRLADRLFRGKRVSTVRRSYCASISDILQTAAFASPAMGPANPAGCWCGETPRNSAAPKRTARAGPC
jgi:hypothetical protein